MKDRTSTYAANVITATHDKTLSTYQSQSLLSQQPVFSFTSVHNPTVYTKVTGSPYILSENGILYYVYGG